MKRICSLFLIGLLLSLCLSAAAYDYGDPVSGAVMSDGAGLLSDGEESALNAQMASLCQQYDINIAIVTTDTLDGKNPGRYANDRYEGLFGANADGILFLLSMEDGDWYIVTEGRGKELLSDGEVYDSVDVISYELGENEFYDAFSAWLQELPGWLDATEPEPQPNFAVSLVIGAVVALIVVLIMRSGMNTKRPQASARHYLVPGTYHLSVAQDFYLYSHISKRPRPKSNSSSGGRGGSRGGGGGKF